VEKPKIPENKIMNHNNAGKTSLEYLENGSIEKLNIRIETRLKVKIEKISCFFLNSILRSLIAR
jgi:hypothetical protein